MIKRLKNLVKNLLSFCKIDYIESIRNRDPAAKRITILELILCYPGIHAIFFHRISNFLWRCKVPILPRLLSHISRMVTGIEIHPGASIGKRLFIDHGIGVVIGETAIIGNDVTMYQGVTLGGRGNETERRHPIIEDFVIIGAGSKILGGVTIGNNSKIGAGTTVLEDIPPHAVIVGAKGHIIKIGNSIREKEYDIEYFI